MAEEIGAVKKEKQPPEKKQKRERRESVRVCACALLGVLIDSWATRFPKKQGKGLPSLSLSGAAVPERGRLEEEEESEAEGRSSERKAKGAMARKHGWQLPAHTLQVQFPLPFSFHLPWEFYRWNWLRKKNNPTYLVSLEILFASGFHSSA